MNVTNEFFMKFKLVDGGGSFSFTVILIQHMDFTLTQPRFQ